MPEVAEMPVANCPAKRPPPERASLAVRLVTMLAILIPLGGVIAAPFFLWGWGFHWTDLGLLLGMYVLTALGITVGFHRLFVHRSGGTADTTSTAIGPKTPTRRSMAGVASSMKERVGTMTSLGLAWHLKLPTVEAQEKARRSAGSLDL